MTIPLVSSRLRPVTRVFVVDDSVVVRRVVARALGREPSLALAGVATNGRAALDKIANLRPDVVVLDLEMPEMDGFETLAVLRRNFPDLPVIVFSHLTAQGAAATLDALALGASAFALKPRADGIGLAEEQVHAELLPLITAVARSQASPGCPATATRPAGSVAAGVSAVVIAVSTGGPNALASIVAELPADLVVPILVVQHMPAVFTKILAERLDRAALVDVVEAVDGEPVVPGRIYLAPGGRHLTVRRAVGGVFVALHDGPPENSCRPAADELFRSAAAAFDGHVLGIVLTGMGHDGLRGAEAVCAAGGRVIAQSSETCVVASMPAAIAAAGLADAVVPLDRIAAEMLSRVAAGR